MRISIESFAFFLSFFFFFCLFALIKLLRYFVLTSKYRRAWYVGRCCFIVFYYIDGSRFSPSHLRCRYLIERFIRSKIEQIFKRKSINEKKRLTSEQDQKKWRTSPNEINMVILTHRVCASNDHLCYFISQCEPMCMHRLIWKGASAMRRKRRRKCTCINKHNRKTLNLDLFFSFLVFFVFISVQHQICR